MDIDPVEAHVGDILGVVPYQDGPDLAVVNPSFRASLVVLETAGHDASCSLKGVFHRRGPGAFRSSAALSHSYVVASCSFVYQSSEAPWDLKEN